MGTTFFWRTATALNEAKTIKLIIQIPCFNEEATLPDTFRDLPRVLDGIDIIEYLVIDDGSSDNTVRVAQDLGIHHIIRNKRNMGLAKTFRRGLDACLEAGADIIVHTDGDNQYCGADIHKLVSPILEGRAEMVIGDRQTNGIAHFSPLKKCLQWLGSGIVRRLAGIQVPDTVSGFRAFSRDAAISLNIVSPFSYTIETVIQAGKRNIPVESVPVRTNPQTRESRLFTGIPSFIKQQSSTVVRMYAMYQPLKVFFYLGALLSVIGLVPIIRFLYFFVVDGGSGHLQSLVLGGALLIMGFMAFLAGLVSDLISFNRQLLEMTLERVKRIELEQRNIDPDEDQDS